MKSLIDELEKTHKISNEGYKELLETQEDTVRNYLFERARVVTDQTFNRKIYTRGLIEFTNYCRNNCYYCGIRRGNGKVSRYRLTEEEILDCCKKGYELGFRTFVLQGGEDPYYTDERMVSMIRQIKKEHPDCALTLSIGEKSYASYKEFFLAGADRYLLRHETASEAHYRQLHPEPLDLSIRKQCLKNLKAIGFQVGTGFMVGSPGQKTENLLEDLAFIETLQPHMVGIGPFLSHSQTPFKEEKNGSLEQTLMLISILRLMLPNALIPATTALGTLHPKGREYGILAGANVVMPNLSPLGVRKQYTLYDHKICTGQEAAESIVSLKESMKAIGYELISHRGDYKED